MIVYGCLRAFENKLLTPFLSVRSPLTFKLNVKHVGDITRVKSELYHNDRYLIMENHIDILFAVLMHTCFV
jgi:hypothetical protein